MLRCLLRAATQLHLNIPRSDILLEADPYRLEQILSNLLVNAAKYTDPGGEIWFGVTRENGDVVFRVKDTGIGIGPDLLAERVRSCLRRQIARCTVRKAVWALA